MFAVVKLSQYDLNTIKKNEYTSYQDSLLTVSSAISHIHQFHWICLIYIQGKYPGLTEQSPFTGGKGNFSSNLSVNWRKKKTPANKLVSNRLSLKKKDIILICTLTHKIKAKPQLPNILFKEKDMFCFHLCRNLF